MSDLSDLPVLHPFLQNIFIDSSDEVNRLVSLQAKFLGYRVRIINQDGTASIRSMLMELREVLKQSTPEVKFFFGYSFNTDFTGVDFAKFVKSVLPTSMTFLITKRAASSFKREIEDGTLTQVWPKNSLIKMRHRARSRMQELTDTEKLELRALSMKAHLWTQIEPEQTEQQPVYIGQPVSEAERHANIVYLGTLSDQAQVGWQISSYKYRHQFSNYRDPGSMLLDLNDYNRDHEFLIPYSIPFSRLTGTDLAKIIKNRLGAKVCLLSNDESLRTFEFLGAENVDSIAPENFCPTQFTPYKKTENPRLRLI